MLTLCDHDLSRRGFLTSLAALAGGAAFADMTALQVLGTPQVAGDLRRNQKRVIMLWLAGGASQLETFDPKPGVPTGGPFQSIQTSSVGIRISELMPRMAARLKDTCIIRSLNTRNADHGSAARIMMRGRMGEPSVDYPDLGAVLAVLVIADAGTLSRTRLDQHLAAGPGQLVDAHGRQGDAGLVSLDLVWHPHDAGAGVGRSKRHGILSRQ